MAEKFKGDPGRMRRKTSEWLAGVLDIDLNGWSALEQSAFADFAVVLGLAPEVKGWSSREKERLAEIIRAKVGASEGEYLRLVQGHGRLKQVMLRMGSGLPH